MFATLRRILRRGSFAARPGEHGGTLSAEISAQDTVMRLLSRAEPNGRVYQLRDLHKETELHQSEALRAVAALKERGVVTLQGGHFDPLSALVRVKSWKN